MPELQDLVNQTGNAANAWPPRHGVSVSGNLLGEGRITRAVFYESDRLAFTAGDVTTSVNLPPGSVPRDRERRVALGRRLVGEEFPAAGRVCFGMDESGQLLPPS